jgi:hypothetical protein
MKHSATMALMVTLGVTGVYAQQRPVRMTFSGNGSGNAIDLKYSGATTVEENVAGIGTLGAFTFRDLRAAASVPQPSSTCAGLFFPSVAGGAIFRFQDGSLLKVHLMQASDCIDLSVLQAHCTLTFQITGGTGRFKDASGSITLTETVVPVLADVSNNPVFFAATGNFRETISSVAMDEGPEGMRP